MDIHPAGQARAAHAYADTNAAIDAINEARVHYYLMKPWDRQRRNCSLLSMICCMIGPLSFAPVRGYSRFWARDGLPRL